MILKMVEEIIFLDVFQYYNSIFIYVTVLLFVCENSKTDRINKHYFDTVLCEQIHLVSKSILQ